MMRSLGGALKSNLAETRVNMYGLGSYGDKPSTLSTWTHWDLYKTSEQFIFKPQLPLIFNNKTERWKGSPIFPETVSEIQQ